ncbi:large ribosomal subunit protein uL2-like [Miscanthus floridulus]|uniref:large ribosomal subunit protein uL2-like n=1 Tax=Miscanthus floridulus TaxID=154761 RepID=UPI003459B4B3
MYTGQLVYCGRRAMLSISDIPPLHGILEGTIICNASTEASEDYAIITTHHPGNGVKAGNASRQRRSTADDGAVDDIQGPPTSLLLRQQRLLSKGGTHHLIYAG